LDAYDISTIGRPETHPKVVEARAILDAYNPNVFTKRGDWFRDLPRERFKYVPFNGALGSVQHEWLRGILDQARSDGDTVLLFTHIPFVQSPGSYYERTLTWDCDETLALTAQYDNILAVFAGHTHSGSHLLKDGIHHITLASPLVCSPGTEAYAILECTSDEEGKVAKVIGVGNIPSVELRRE